jgi:hypothetical protein
MSKMKNLLDEILNCNLCYGQGAIYYSNGEDYDFDYCECNPYSLIVENGEIIHEGDFANV